MNGNPSKERFVFSGSALPVPLLALGAVVVGLCAIPCDAADPAISADWLARVQRDIAESEYHITWADETNVDGVDATWQAPNRAHGFRTWFTADGIRVVPRTQADPSWEWGLSFIGHGRGNSMRPVNPAQLSPQENRVTYDRGDLVEWYVNGRKGLKQGFTLAVAPERDSGEPVFLDLALTGNLSPTIGADGQAVDFRSPNGGNVIHYAELNVYDARDRELPARMEGFARAGVRGIRIVVDDAGATYPLTVDPLATSPAWTVEGDQANGWYGTSVATAGDIDGDGYADVVVGATSYDAGPDQSGAAFVYLGAGSGPAPVANWKLSPPPDVRSFGGAVATAGDVNGDGYADVMVGAPQAAIDGVGGLIGAAFIYHGSAGGLAATADWEAWGTHPAAFFGRALGPAGDVNGDGYSDVVIGSPGNDPERVYVYHGSPSGLSASADWMIEQTPESYSLGSSVGTAGDVNGDGYADVIVGAQEFSNGETREGKASVYHGSASGLSTSAAWEIEGGQAEAFLGYSAGTAGDVNGDGYADVIVGAHQYDNDQTDDGAVWVYHGSGAGLSTTASWAAEGSQDSEKFGTSVSTAGDVNGDGYADVIVGAMLHDNDQTDEGGAWVYHGSAAGLSTTASWQGEGDQDAAWYGQDVSTAGDVNGDGYDDVIVGAYAYDVTPGGNEGRAHVYLGAPGGLSETAGWSVEGDIAGLLLGFAVGTAGDVNGDGHADVILGCHTYDVPAANTGRAWVHFGGPSGPSPTADWTASGEDAGNTFGDAVGTAGDVNGDGYADVIVGATRYAEPGQYARGRVYVYHGSPGGLSTTPDWYVTGQANSDYLGRIVGTAGDVNGDGFADVLISPWGWYGEVYVHHGSATGLSPTADWVGLGSADDWVESGAAAGDVNGDGYSDVMMADLGVSGSDGTAYVYHGSSSGLSTSPDWVVGGVPDSGRFGFALSTAGDVNGDGFADVLVGAPYYDNATTADVGRVYAYYGSTSGLSTTEDWLLEGDQAGASLGYRLATAGDVNGDGFADIAVDTPWYDDGALADAGRVQVFYGSASGLPTTENWVGVGGFSPSEYGFGIGTGGDVNGDGYADLLVGEPGYGNGQAQEGIVRLYYGNEGLGLSVRPQQRRATDVAPIAPLCASDAPDRFRLAALGRTPFGRGRIKLEWEVKPLGSPLNGIVTKGGVHWSDTGVTGVDLSELETGLIDEEMYHWRVRLLYDPVTTPYAQHSRWFTVPWNGWQEADLRTGDPAAAGRVPDQEDWPGQPLTVEKAGGSKITLTWGGSCLSTDFDYAIYEGEIGDFGSHESRYCSTGGETSRTFTPLAGNTYYLVVPLSGTREGSYGVDSTLTERPVGLGACLPQEIGSCE